MIILVINALLTYLPLLICIAFIILGERKMLAAIQRRLGPDRIGWYGLLQSFVDGSKLILKENVAPDKSNKFLFYLAAFFIFILSLSSWSMVPVDSTDIDGDYSCAVFMIFIYSAINVYCVLFAGWSSNSKYAFLGAIRSAAQMISYEVYFGLLLVPIFLFSESFDLLDIIFAQEDVWFIVYLFPVFIMFFITTLAETNRTPFDLPEAEAEIVAGYNVEYSSLTFSLFFLAEYNNIFLSCAYMVIFFFGGFFFAGYSNALVFFIKLVFLSSLFVAFRGILPRYRYDQLMNIGWKKFFPIIMGFVLFYSSYIIYLNVYV